MARYSTGLSYYLTESCLGLGSLNIETQKRMWMLEVFLGNDLRKQQVGSGEDETGDVRHVSEKWVVEVTTPCGQWVARFLPALPGGCGCLPVTVHPKTKAAGYLSPCSCCPWFEGPPQDRRSKHHRRPRVLCPKECLYLSARCPTWDRLGRQGYLLKVLITGWGGSNC